MRTGFVRIHQVWKLGALCGLVLLLAGCPPVPSPTPTRGPIAVASVGASPIAGGFRINGAGWTPGSTVVLSLESRTRAGSTTRLPLAALTATTEGHFTAQYRWSVLPSWQPDLAYNLVAIGAGQQAQTPFDLSPLSTATAGPTPSPTPSTTSNVFVPLPGISTTATPTRVIPALDTPSPPVLAVTPDSGQPGTTVRVSGRSWPAGSVVYVSLGIPGSPPAADVYAASVVDAQGQFLANFVFPNEARWLDVPQVIVAARTADSRTTAQASFAPVRPAVPIREWLGEYFNNRDLTGTPVLARNDARIEFAWGEGSPAASVPPDRFSARWTRSLPLEAGDYRFYANSDDGIRVWVDNRAVIDQWNDGGRLRVGDVSGLGSGNHAIKVEYYESSGGAYASVWWERTGPITDWRGEYFDNPGLQGDPFLVRNDSQVNFDWGTAAPATGMPADNFSVRWQRTLDFEAGGYRFNLRADDGARLWIDNRLVIDRWQGGDGQTTYSGDLSLGGGPHTVRVDYVEGSGNASVQLSWQRTGATPTYQPAISVYEFDMEQFMVQGRGWPAGATVEIALARLRPGGNDISQYLQTFGTVTVAPDGTFLVRYFKPGSSLPNLHIVALTGNYQAIAPYYLR